MKSVEKLIIFCFLFKGVLCREFSISLPESVEAVRRLCVLIPCRFEIKEQYDGDLQKDPTGIWYKDGTHTNDKRVFNSKVTEENKIEGEIIGDLHMKNCTTIFYNIRQNYSGVYYFRIETSGPLIYTYTSRSVSVRVRAPPCLLKTPTFTWNFLPEERRQEQNHNTRFSSSQLNFSATHLHHGLNFTCTATYQLQNRNKSAQSSFILHVLYGPRNTSVSASPSASVLLGSSVSLRCSSDANPAVLNYTWYRENGEQIGTGNHLTINTTDSTHSGLYYCRAQNQHGDHNSSVLLDVLYGPRNTSVSASPSASVLLGSAVSLRCSSDANPAVLIYTWYRENGEQIGTGNHLTINTTDSTHSGLYYCRAQNQHGDHNSSILLDVLYAPQLSPSSSCNTTQEVIRCFCEFHGNPSPKLEWRNSGQTVFPSDNISTWAESVSNNTLRSFISIGPPVNDMLTPQCVGTNKLGVTSQVFFSILNKAQCSDAGPDVNISSVLIGAAVGASVMMILCGVFLCVRKASPLQSGPGDSAGFDTVEDEEFVYSNKTVLSESLHYSTVVFPNGEGSEIRGLSKLTADYAVIRHSSKHLTEGGVPETAIEEVQEVMGTNMEQEEATYGNITRPSDDGAN